MNLPLGKDRTLFFSKQVEQDSIEEISKSILEINEDDEYLKKLYKIHDLDYKPKPIKIMIDSYGGNIYQIMGLLSIMDKSKTKIHTIVTGTAMSCGFLLLIHGHKRFAYEHSTPMYHQASQLIIGSEKLQDIEDGYVELKRLQDKMEELTSKKTRITKIKLNEVLKEKKDWFMDSKEALKLGVVDEII